MSFSIERTSLKEKMLELAKKAKYIVEINGISKNKSLTLFPNRLFGSPVFKGEEIVHEVYKSGPSHIIKRTDKEGTKRFIVPDYAIRPFIIQDIIVKCHMLGIDLSLCVAYNENRTQCEAIDVVPGPEGISRELEKQVLPLYQKIEIDKEALPKIQKLKINEGIIAIDNYVKSVVDRFINQEN